jgi:dolichol-phosphate mannosyltransferase
MTISLTTSMPSFTRSTSNDVVRVAVIVPAYRVRDQINEVIAGIPAWVAGIYVVDDACPEGSGDWVEENNRDPRVRVLRHECNQGVGGAVSTGYSRALADGADVLVKMDGDGQMDPALLPQLLGPILRGDADYTKGNRFYDLDRIAQMPPMRLLGNAVLSFMTKLSSGYWDIFDPTNGYTALHARVAGRLAMAKISRRYFFETDMLFRLNTIRAVVVDVPMEARYEGESSSLRIGRIVHEFLFKHIRNTAKRLFYNYFLRDLSLASGLLVTGALFVGAGTALGLRYWYLSNSTGVPTLAGSVMLVALLVIVGIQLLLGFLAQDIASVPRRALHPLLMPSNSHAQ